MRKIYSLVLMAAALLVGTNAWASLVTEGDKTGSEEARVTRDGGSTWMYAPTLKEAFDDVLPGQTAQIELLDNVNLTAPITMPATINSTVLAGTCQNITLNLNNKEITADQNVTVFRLIKGTLNIEGKGSIKKTSTGSNVWEGGAVIVVCGAEAKTAANWSNLTIGKDVIISITPGSTAGTGIIIQDMDGLERITDNNDPLKTAKDNWETTFGYCNYYYPKTAIWTDGSGDEAKLNAVCGDKEKGLPLACGALAAGNTNVQQGAAFGVKITIAGTIIAGMRGLQIIGHVNQKPVCTEDDNITKRDTTRYKSAPYYKYQYPYINITSTAHINSSNQGGCAGIYASGYGVFDIAGEVYGATGVYLKASDVRLIDAVIFSNSDTYEESYGGNSGTGNARGSAIAIESNDAYAGGSGLNITGDTRVTGGGGYAISDATYKKDGGSTTSAVTIEGGTIEAGSAGAMVITDGTAPNTTVVAGTFDNNAITVTHGDAPATTTAVNTYTPSNTHTTVVTDGDKTIIVISEGAAPTSEQTQEKWSDIDHLATGSNAKWTGTGNPDDANFESSDGYGLISTGNTVKLGELQMISGTGANAKQVLVIQNGATLDTRHLMMNKYAQIIVEAGGKLIVEGSQGIIAPVSENILLKSTANNQATFVISNEVSSNKQPNATVEYTLLAYQDGPSSWKYQRFTAPVCVMSAPTNDATPSTSYYDGTSLITYGLVINDDETAWEPLTRWKDIRPFHVASLSNNTNAGENITYTFKGKLMGNVVDSLQRRDHRWNYYGNSYTAPMSTKSLLEAMSGQPVEASIWFWNMSDQIYESFNLTMSSEFGGLPAKFKSIPSYSFFVLKNVSGEAGDLNINYSNTVYQYALTPNDASFGAPTRSSSNSTTVTVEIESENGVKDILYVLENDKYNAEYEAGADIEKLMNGNGLNVYATDEAYNYNLIATDDIEGTLISLTTNEDINYTLTFGSVRGEVYALRDNLTNAVVLMNEGATYSFTAQPNATLDGRFQIVSRQEMPTAVETIEETVAPKAIYTVMGQYVGETTDWNSLPAGVYVVDGVKVIK